MSKRFQMVGVRGSTQEKSRSEIFRFGYRKAANDKMVPDPVGSGCKGLLLVLLIVILLNESVRSVLLYGLLVAIGNRGDI